MKRLIGMVVLVVAVVGCSNSPASESLPYWYVRVEGRVHGSDGTPVPGASVRWEHWSPTCDSDAVVEDAVTETDDQGAYEVVIQVEDADGCFAFTATDSAGSSPTVFRTAEDLPLRQRQPYDTVRLELTLTAS